MIVNCVIISEIKEKMKWKIYIKHKRVTRTQFISFATYLTSDTINKQHNSSFNVKSRRSVASKNMFEFSQHVFKYFWY